MVILWYFNIYHGSKINFYDIPNVKKILYIKKIDTFSTMVYEYDNQHVNYK